MSDHLVPAGPPPDGAHQLQAWQEPRAIVEPLPVSPLHRPVAALRRYKWLILAVIALSSVGGYVATRFVKPQYGVDARLMMTDTPFDQSASGGVKSMGLLANDDWTQLLKSYQVADGVIRKLTLFLQTSSEDDRNLFHGFTVDDDGFIASKYQLLIDRPRKRWTLTIKPAGTMVDSGGATDSLGKAWGLKWQLEKSAFVGTGKRTVDFTLVTPREEAVTMLTRLTTGRKGSFINMALQDPDPKLAASIVNTWLADFSTTAASLKQTKLVESAALLEQQLKTAKDSLDAADVRLSTFRINTITLPSEATNAITAGITQTTGPVEGDYFSKKVAQQNLHQAIINLRASLAEATAGKIPWEAVLPGATAMLAGKAGEPLNMAITKYMQTKEALQQLHLQYGDSMAVVKENTLILNSLTSDEIPRAAADLITSLRATEVTDSIRLVDAEGNMKGIPERTIEEERLQRAFALANNLYTTVQSRYSQAQLLKAGETPDFTILDSAVAPLEPNKNTKIRLILIAVAGGIGVALGLAILLDLLDGRLRYPEQITNELGLSVAGTVPRFPKGGVNQNSPEEMYQLVESFRSLRMSVLNAGNGGAVSFAVSSPQPGDGKSLISANLAMSFADAGLRTIIVDGDTRRGSLHEVFTASNAPGLTDYLAGAVSLADIVRTTGDPHLFMIPSGTRQRRSPELLTSPRLAALVDELRANYDVVMFDTPPLAAGIDGYSIAAATGSLLVVLRVGATKRRLSADKLRMFERLPVSIIGAVLNGIAFEDGNEHYSYVPGYAAIDEPPGTALAEVP